VPFRSSGLVERLKRFQIGPQRLPIQAKLRNALHANVLDASPVSSDVNCSDRQQVILIFLFSFFLFPIFCFYTFIPLMSLSGLRLRRLRLLFDPLLLLLLLFFLLFGSGSGQRELEIDVAFVARIFDELLLIRQPPHHEFHAIRFRPGSGIIQRESVKQVRIIQALPALGKTLARSAVRIRREIGVFDD
jgi:hypothetical protein